MKFQFQIDGRGFGSPIRDTWKDAVQDAVNAGYGHWDNDSAYLETNQGASIARIQENDLNVRIVPVVSSRRCNFCLAPVPPLAVGPVVCAWCGNITTDAKPVYRPSWWTVFLIIVDLAVLFLLWLLWRST